MKSQKTTIFIVSMILFVAIGTFAQDKKRERLSPEKMFEKLDANEDGKIVKDEIKNERMLKRFDKMDANSDGAITLDELENAFDKGKKAVKANKKGDNLTPRKLFDLLDLNNDDRIVKDEIVDDRMLNRFDKIDSDNDGAITFQELEKSYSKRKK